MTTMFRNRFIAATLLLLCQAKGASAQEPSGAGGHQGFWISAGLGASALSCLSCSTPSGGRWDGIGFGGYFALGGRLRSNLLVGGDMTVAGRTDIGEANAEGQAPQAAHLTVSGIIQYYPFGKGLFIVGGPSAGVASITGGGRLIEAPAVGGLVGIGYDFRMGSKFALTPWLRLSQLFSEATTGHDPLDEVPKNPQAWIGGVALSWY